MEGNYAGIIIRGTIIQAPIVRKAILLEAIVWGQLSEWGQLSGGNYPGENCWWGNYPGAIVKGYYPGGNYLRTTYDISV